MIRNTTTFRPMMVACVLWLRSCGDSGRRWSHDSFRSDSAADPATRGTEVQ